MHTKALISTVLTLATLVVGRHHHNHDAHHHSHDALMPLLNTALLDPSSLIASPDKECSKTCTPGWGGSLDGGEFEGCTGVYEQVCHSKDAKHLYSRLVCEGIWYSKSKNATSNDGDESPDFSACEGGFSFFMKGVHGASETDPAALVGSAESGEESLVAAADEVAVATGDEEHGGPAAFAIGYGCFGKMTAMVTEHTLKQLSRYTTCDEFSGHFMAGKPLPAGPDQPASTEEALKQAEDIGIHQIEDFFKGLAPGSGPPGPHGPPDGSPRHTDHHEHHGDDHDHWPHWPHHNHDHEHDHDDHEHSCKVTCNGNPLKLWGLLPCWGKLELTCSGDHGSFTATCKGSTWPIFGSCHGLYSLAASGDKGTVYAVNAGKHKAGPIHSHPHPEWKGIFETSKGRASVFMTHHHKESQDASGLSSLEPHLSALSALSLPEMNPDGLLKQLANQ